MSEPTAELPTEWCCPDCHRDVGYCPLCQPEVDDDSWEVTP